MSIGDDSRRPPRPAAHELERYEALFATRTGRMRSSVMRDLMAVTDRPEIISLAGGLPDTSLFAPALFSAAMDAIAKGTTAQALQYGPTDGLQAVKDCIVEIMAEEETVVAADELIVTTGGQQAIDLVCKALLDPGDVVIAEGPTYPGAVPTFCAYEAQLVQIEMDGEGMQIDLLEQTLDELAAAGRRPKFIYTIPTFQNPAGVTMSLPRRRRLIEVARQRELLVLEDNPYGLLRYEGEALPTLRSLEVPRGSRDGGDFVIYTGTMSKILSAGIRVGWVVAPRPVLAKLNLGKVSADLCSSSLTQHFVAAYFAGGDWREYVGLARDAYRLRRDAMLDALAEMMPAEASWTHPRGGLFVWLTLPEFIDTTNLLARALRENVAFVPGEGAYDDGRGHNAMRLNFSSVSEDRIREGIRRIAKIVNEQLALYGALTAGKAQPAQPADLPAKLELADVVELPRRSPERSRRSRPA
ncbi:MAG: PLP-dependent aminotransferase family protein [Solirubrobacteraceae bacterium]|jgi:2-aminoadipate transaminase